MVDVAASSYLEENVDHPNGVFIYSVCGCWVISAC